MAAIKYVEIIERLHAQTQKGLLKWSPTARGSFLLSFANYSIELSTEQSEDPSERDYRLAIRSSNGTVIESLSDVEIAHELGERFERVKFFKTFSELYALARRKALGADEAIDAIIEELKDSDLPF